MKQFLTVLRFEFLNYTRNKIFMISTVGLVLLVGILLSFPRIVPLFEKDDLSQSQGDTKDMIALQDHSGANPEETLQYFKDAMPDKEFVLVEQDQESLMAQLEAETYAGVIVLQSPLKYQYIVKTITMTDTMQSQINGLITNKYRFDEMKRLGISQNQAQGILGVTADSEVIQIGKNQVQNFMFTYIIIFALYMAILLYGQFVATSVAAEKSTKTMEVLITSAKPVNLIFGKVIGAGLAGLLQLFAIFGSSFVFYNSNQSLWSANAVIQSIFDIPLSVLLYGLLFFILGYFIYSFIYGAIGSLASKTEDINSSTLPITLVFVGAFILVMFSMSTGDINSTIMMIASYIPFTSPMAMFARITMGEVKSIEIFISVVILIGSTIGIGCLSARIYKMGVLLYGSTPKLTKLLKNQKRNK